MAMSTIQVESLTFAFNAAVSAGKYDQWQHYTKVWNVPPGGRKAVDVVAVEAAPRQSTAWLLEAKDFRVITNPPKACNVGGLARLVADKARDTLAGLAHARNHAVVEREQLLATAALAATAQRIVLHLEPHTGAHTALFPTGFAAGILQQLQQLVRDLDPKPQVLNLSNTRAAGVPWNVS